MNIWGYTFLFVCLFQLPYFCAHWKTLFVEIRSVLDVNEKYHLCEIQLNCCMTLHIWYAELITVLLHWRDTTMDGSVIRKIPQESAGQITTVRIYMLHDCLYDIWPVTLIYHSILGTQIITVYSWVQVSLTKLPCDVLSQVLDDLSPQYNMSPTHIENTSQLIGFLCSLVKFYF